MVADLASVAPNKPSLLYHVGDVVYYFGEAKEYFGQFYEPYEAERWKPTPSPLQDARTRSHSRKQDTSNKKPAKRRILHHPTSDPDWRHSTNRLLPTRSPTTHADKER